MKVFISWSGERSKKVATLFKTWLKCVIQASDPWISTQDIQSGSWWFNEIGEQLSGTNIGIVCLTKDNKDNPWILFETGALTKGLSTSRVCPFLVDLTPSEVAPPLSHLNLTKPDKESLRSLVWTINLSMKDGILSSDVFEKVFETYWDQFERDFNEILSSTETPIKAKDRPRDEILNEILSTVRSFDNRLRKVEKNKNETEFVNLSEVPNSFLIDFAREYIIKNIDEVKLYGPQKWLERASNDITKEMPFKAPSYQIRSALKEGLLYQGLF